MKHLSICLALALIIIGSFATASLAGPQGYCESFAREAASRKTGHTDAPAGTIGGDMANTASPGAITSDGKWREAYDTAFSGCMSQYESDDTAAAKIDTPAVKAAKPAQPAKVSRPHRTHHAKSKKAVSKKTANKKAVSKKPASRKATNRKATNRKATSRKASPSTAKVKAAGDSSPDDDGAAAPEKAAPATQSKTPSNPAANVSTPPDAAAASKAKPQDSQTCHTLVCLLGKRREKQ